MRNYNLILAVIFLVSFVSAQIPYPGHPGVEVCDNNLCVIPGSVGIGTISPNVLYALDVVGIINTDKAARIGFVDSSTGWSIEADQIGDYATLRFDSNKARFWADGGGAIVGKQEVMTITEDGFVGIGVTAPQRRLHVSSNGLSAQTSRFESDSFGGAQIAIVGTEPGGREWRVGTGISLPGNFDVNDATASATRLSIDSTGRVGIGTTTPDILTSLEVVGSVNSPVIQVNGSGAQVPAFSIVNDLQRWSLAIVPGFNNKFTILDSDQVKERLTIDEQGNIGIGIPGLQATTYGKLNVGGNINATGDICTDQGGVVCLSNTVDIAASSGYPEIVCASGSGTGSSCSPQQNTGYNAPNEVTLSVYCDNYEIPLNCGGGVRAYNSNFPATPWGVVRRSDIKPFYNVGGQSGCTLIYSASVNNAEVYVSAACVKYKP